MRVLIDACLPILLKQHLRANEVRTARELGWQFKKNGDLLAAAHTRFDVVITMDKNIPAQNYLARFTLGLVIVRTRSNRLADLMPWVPEMILAIARIRPGDVIVIPREG